MNFRKWFRRITPSGSVERSWGPFNVIVNGPAYAFMFEAGDFDFWVWDKDHKGTGFIFHLTLLSEYMWFCAESLQVGCFLERHK